MGQAAAPPSAAKKSRRLIFISPLGRFIVTLDLGALEGLA
jgi:hypothetical protein